MGQRVAAPKSFAAGLLWHARRSQRIPHLVVQRQVEIGQDHCPLRQLTHHPQQPRQGRRGAGDARRNNRMRRRVRLPSVGGAGEQQVAPRRWIDLTPIRQLRQPQGIQPQETPGAGAPMFGLLAHQSQHIFRQQILRGDALHRQTVYGAGGFKGAGQQRRALGGILALLRHDQRRDPQPAPHRIDRRGNLSPGAQRVQSRPQRLVQIEIAHHHHARQQQAAPPPGADKGLGNGAPGALAGHQQCEACQPQFGFGIARDQPRNQRVGKATVRRNGIYCQPPALDVPGLRPIRLRHGLTAPRWGRWRPGRQLRTTAPYARSHRAAPRQWRGPTRCWWKKPPPAHHAASDATPVECRYR